MLRQVRLVLLGEVLALVLIRPLLVVCLDLLLQFQHVLTGSQHVLPVHELVLLTLLGPLALGLALTLRVFGLLGVLALLLLLRLLGLQLISRERHHDVFARIVLLNLRHLLELVHGQHLLQPLPSLIQHVLLDVRSLVQLHQRLYLVQSRHVVLLAVLLDLFQVGPLDLLPLLRILSLLISVLSQLHAQELSLLPPHSRDFLPGLEPPEVLLHRDDGLVPLGVFADLLALSQSLPVFLLLRLLLLLDLLLDVHGLLDGLSTTLVLLDDTDGGLQVGIQLAPVLDHLLLRLAPVVELDQQFVDRLVTHISLLFLLFQEVPGYFDLQDLGREFQVLQNVFQVDELAPDLVMMGVESDQLLVALDHADHAEIEHFLEMQPFLGVHHLVEGVLEDLEGLDVLDVENGEVLEPLVISAFVSELEE